MTLQHGVRHTYLAHKCRCDFCRAANAAYQRERAAMPKPPQQRRETTQRRGTPADFDEPLCAQVGPDWFFLDGKGESYKPEAIALCRSCKHQTECAEYAIPFFNLDGLWGGLTPTQRARIRKDRNIPGRSIETPPNVPRRM